MMTFVLQEDEDMTDDEDSGSDSDEHQTNKVK